MSGHSTEHESRGVSATVWLPVAVLIIAGLTVAGQVTQLPPAVILIVSISALLLAALALYGVVSRAPSGLKGERLEFVEAPNGVRVFTAGPERVRFTVPHQGKKTFVERLNPGTLADAPTAQQGPALSMRAKTHSDAPPSRLFLRFDPIARLVIDVRFVDEHGALLTVFDPPIVLEVAYTQADAEAVGGEDHLALASVDHGAGRWCVYTEADGFRIDKPNKKLIVERVMEWDDRHTGIGGS